MLCQLCGFREATRSVLNRLPNGELVQGDYCASCFDAKFVHPPAIPPEAPRPTFTIKRIMILVAVFTVPNAVVAWVMRSGLVAGTTQELDRWTPTAFLAVNLVFGLIVAQTILGSWLQKVAWQRRTGGVIPFRSSQQFTPQETRRALRILAIVLSALVVWMFVAMCLARWMTSLIWPIQNMNFLLYFLLVNAPFPIILLLYPPARRRLADQRRQWLRTSSKLERIWRRVTWAALVLVLLVASAIYNHQIRTAPGYEWTLIVGFVAFLVIVSIVLQAGHALTIRRR